MSPFFPVLKKQDFPRSPREAFQITPAITVQLSIFGRAAGFRRRQSDKARGARLLAPSWQSPGHRSPWHSSVPAQPPALAFP